VRNVVKTIELTASNQAVKFSCVKISGISSHELLETISKLLEYKNKNPSYQLPWLNSNASYPDKPTLSVKELKDWEAVNTRLLTICDAAAKHKTPLLIDAEQTWIQPAIDYIAIEVIKKYNTTEPVIYNTYQMYLKKSYNNLKRDIQNATVSKYILGVKLVRGAYMISERDRSAIQNIEDPILPNIEETHESYHSGVKIALSNLQHVSIMIATHNKESVIYSTKLMQELSIANKHPRVFFGQLYGMCDHISLPLGQAGYQATKYVPFGPVNEVIPYLTRRIQENSGLIARTTEERYLLFKEITNRLLKSKVKNSLQ